MMRFALLTIPFLLMPLALASGYSVTVTLDAKWSDTPFVAEISEFLAAEDSSLFWRYIDSLAELVAEDKLAPTEDGEAVLSAVLSAAKSRLSEGHAALLELALSSRAYSAAVEVNNQLSAAAIANSSFPCPADAKFWISLDGRPLCSLAELQSALKEPEAASSAAGTVRDLRLRTDKVFGQAAGHRRSSGLPTGVLYADLRYKEMYAVHAELKTASLAGKIEYIFRHRIVNINKAKTRLTGYGVELAMKSTEYKAMDDSKMTSDNSSGGGSSSQEEQVAGFDFATLRDKHPGLTKELNNFRQHLLETATEIVPLKAWQFQDLSFQAAQRVATATTSDGLVLETLEDVSQNYPLRANSLSKIAVTSSFRSEIFRIQGALDQHLGLPSGSSALFINGYLVNDLDPFAILELLRREAKLMEGLHNMGILGTQINKVLRTQLPDSSGSTKFILDLREMPIAFLNDLEDGSARYYGWPSSVRSLLEHAFPGMLRRVAKNLFHLILIVDPSAPECWPVLRYAQAFVMHSAPVRMGLVWAVKPPEADGSLSAGEAMVRAFNFIHKEEDDPLPALEFLLSLINQAEVKGSSSDITTESVRTAFKKRQSAASAERTFDPKSAKFADRIEEGRRYLAQSGLSSRLPHSLLNGALLDRKQVKDMFEETVVGFILEQTPVLQREVYDGRLTDSTPTLEFLMTRPDVVSRLNQMILDNENANFVELGRMGMADTTSPIDKVHPDDLVERLASSLTYVSKREDTPKIRPVSVWLVTDLAKEGGRSALLGALKLLRSSPKLRLAVVHSAPERAVKFGDADLVHIVQAAFQLLPSSTARLFVAKLVKEDNVQALSAGRRTLKDLSVSDMDFEDFAKRAAALSRDYARLHSAVASKVLRVTDEAYTAVVVNGKVLGPLKEAQIFGPDDWRLLERVTLEIGGAGVLAERIGSMSWAGKNVEALSDLTMRAGAILQAAAGSPELTMASASSKRRYAPLEVGALSGASEAVVRLFGDASRPAFELVAVLDPLSREAQKMSSVLRVLRQAVNCNLHIIFSCRSKLSEAPLKNFYRLAWSPKVTSASWGRALFDEMPGSPLLTLGMDAPHSWLVAAVRSPSDLDNIRLKGEPGGRVNAHFELEHLLLEGHCVDTVTGQPPRGLQFTLGSRRDLAEMDTIVMANLGYFQMKANPGAWFLQLRTGRSSQIYDISGHEYADSLPEASELIAVIDSLRSKIIRVRVSKKKDQMDANLLGDDDASSGGMGAGLWNSISSAFRGSKKKSGDQEVLNIFSVASGHLYERFLRIMMLSVLKHTKQPVKFWFLKNYLSPTFKDFIPHMAKAYNFQFELVQYKWPRWLHQQTEKQRIIWGYKILFLDVLFPLDVQKIIFVDADQIVRTDLQELADLDLEGAPYGYTPFCDSRKEMDGFRFWKSGYWAGHLGPRRYHISALYVVDLLRFRRLAAGDRLRGQYQGLSQDPNSLSNLDQDLPNNMIHQVPIKSLPQEWLWCETWCATSELARAKTIDLCNNPLTKEPKLQAAMRIVPEWKDYDQEVKRVWDRVYGTHTAEASPPKAEEGDTTTTKKKKKKEEL